jgi:N-acetylmuramoyl-L-alanine amidase
MPSVLIETGFVNNYEDAYFLNSEDGQRKTAAQIYEAIIRYSRKANIGAKEAPRKEEKKEVPLKNDFRILLMSTPIKYNYGDPAFKGLNYILPVKENGLYKYYYSVSNLASVRDANLRTAKDAGFRNAVSVGFVPNQSLSSGYYTLEVFVGKDKLSSDSYILKNLKDVKREKANGMFYYTYGTAKTLEEAVKLQKGLEEKGMKNSVIQKVAK